MGCDDYHDPFENDRRRAHRTNYEQALQLGFRDYSPNGIYYGTDSIEHVAVCDHCAALVHYPLPPSEFPPEYVKGTDTLRKHLQSVHPEITEAIDERVHGESVR